MDSSGLLQDSTPPTGRFRPYASTKHRVTRGRYITSNDPRGYIPVYEYPLNGQYIMMDIDDGYILWTGIWKALGNAKADIVKMLESQPDLAPQLRRVRGGYLKIQGTWMPHSVALRLARRVAWTIREDLIPLFGPTFPSTCLSPEEPGYGQISDAQQGRRRGRRAAMALPAAPPANQAPSQPPVAGGSNAIAPQQGGSLQGASGLSLLSAAAAGEHGRLGHSSQIPIAGAGASSSRHMEYQQSAGDWGASHGAPTYTGSPPGDPHRASGMVRPHATSPAVLYGVSDSSMGPPPLPSSSRPPPSYGAISHSPKSAGRIRERDGHGHPGLGRHSSISSLESRFNPYPSTGRRRSSSNASGTFPLSSKPSPVDLPPLTIPPPPPPPPRSGTGLGPNFSDVRSKLSQSSSHFSASASAPTSTSLTTPLGAAISLPPIKEPAMATGTGLASSLARYRSGSIQSNGSAPGFVLPPISSMDGPPSSLSSHSSPAQYDSSAVLDRLKLDDEMLGRARLRLQGSDASAGQLSSSYGGRSHQTYEHRQPTTEQLMTRRRSLSAPPPHPDYFSRRVEQAVTPGSHHQFTRSRTSPTDESRSLADSGADPQGRGATSTAIVRGPPVRSPREGVEDPSRRRSPLVLSPRPEHYHRPLSSGSSQSRSRVGEDRREGERSGGQVPYHQHVLQHKENSLPSSIHSLTPPGANPAQAHAVRSSQPGSQDQYFPPPNYNAELESYRFGQHAEGVRDGSPPYRSNEGSNLDMEIEPELPIGFHSSEAQRRERIRPW